MTIVPIEVSARHIHLCKHDLDIIFGLDYKLSPVKKISQIGQFAANETVIIKNGDKQLLNVRIVGPVRQDTQVELSISDSIRLGIKPPIKKSGIVNDAAMLTIIGDKGSVTKTCAIIPQRHIHASVEDAKKYNLYDGQIVSVKCGLEREVVFSNVVVRVDKNFVWNFHIDVDEYNAAGLTNNEFGIVIE
jgi:propanediol utilization protein